MSAVPRALARNWQLKLSAFGLAVVLWAVVQAGIDAGGIVTLPQVPVVAQVNDMDWILEADPSPPNVRVSLEAPPNVLTPIRTPSAVVRIPVDEVVDADTVIQLRRDWVQLEGGTGYVVQEISPATVRLSFQRTRSELLPVAVRTTGELLEGLALAAPIGIQPQTVRVRGPVSRVEAVDSVVLDPLDLSSVVSSGIYTVAVDTSSVTGLSTVPAEVSLGVRLEQAVERILGGVPVVVETSDGAVSDAVEVLPSTLQVTLRGARTVVSSTDPEEVRAAVTAEAVEGLEPGYQRRVPIVLRGVPELVRAFAPVDSVTVRRPPSTGAGPAGGGGAAEADTAGGGGGAAADTADGGGAAVTDTVGASVGGP